MSRRIMYLILPSVAVPAWALVLAFLSVMVQVSWLLSGSVAEPPFSQTKFSFSDTVVLELGKADPKFDGYEVKKSTSDRAPLEGS